MDEIDFLSPDHTQAESSQNASRGSGLRLVIPSLKSIQALKGKKKGRGGAFQDVPVQKVPRPVKLKPLREVLTKLIIQIKKKDDYAFFLTPVDPSQTPGYTDIVKQPMDLGSMSMKVDKGKYRSLEEFATDLRLVTGNAKLFNPPGSIYYTEADRIEAFALSHITKAAATVIEFETDWNIDIENEGEPTPTAGDDDEEGREKSTAMDLDGSVRARSPSLASTGTPVQGPSRSRPSKAKKKMGMLSETLEDDGHLPGYKDGVGVFPPESEFSELMLSLKLKGKRYRTKKERMRIERGGPPVHVDGSLDYPEMEDPFSVLSIFLPEPMSKPLLTSLYPPAKSTDPSRPTLPSSVNRRPAEHPPSSSSRNRLRGKHKHWTITRVSSSRRFKDTNDDETLEPWQVPREPHHVDYGSFPTLVDQLAEEAGATCSAADLSSAERLLQAIRSSVDGPLPDYSLTASPSLDQGADGEGGYWKQKASQSEDYIRDVVYGGVEGLAYVRSLATFVHHDVPTAKAQDPPEVGLGVPLAQWAAENIVTPLTDGRHRLLQDTALHLRSPTFISPTYPELSTMIDRSLRLFPQASHDLASLQSMSKQLLDMASLIKKPEELFVADDVWEGASYMEEQRRQLEAEKEKALVESPEKNAAEYLAFAIQSHKEAEAPKAHPTYETPDVLLHALKWSASAIEGLVGKGNAGERTEDAMDVDEKPEDPHMRKLRLNLLALSKRAPLDRVARLPAELVPSHIRHVIPTLESVT